MGPTFDGIMTFIAALVALIAAARAYKGIKQQIKSDRENLQRQLDAEKNARAEEQERQSKAVAIAILFEIDGFYRLHLREVHRVLENWDPKNDALFMAKSISAISQPFPVYYGNSGSLGLLEVCLVFSVVNFYSAAAIFVETFNDYKAESGRCGYGTGLTAVPEAMGARVHDARTAEVAARHLGEQLKKASPRLIKLTCAAVRKLCERTGTAFQAPMIAAAAEGLCLEGTALQQQTTDAQAH
jgi:hypothetical protein